MGQGWLLFELTHSALMLGYLGAAAAIPAILMTLFGGVLADQLNKRYLLMTTSLLVAFLLAVLGALDYLNLAQAWHVILIAGMVSFVSGFDWPTRQAIFPTLIAREDMLSAVALNSIIWQSCRMVMPALGGIVLAFTDTWVIFFFCSLGFIVMFVVVAGLRLNIQNFVSATGSTFTRIIEGVRFILNRRTFLILISLSYGGMFFVSSFMQLMPAFAELLDIGESGYGYLISITGVGSVIGTMLVGAAQQSRRLGRIILVATFLSGMFIYLFAVSTGLLAGTRMAYPLAMAAALLVSLFSSVFMITSMTVLQLQVPDHLRGRVMGFHGITYSMMPLGGLLSGYIATLVSAPFAIALCASVYLLMVVVIALTQPVIRHIDGSS